MFTEYGGHVGGDFLAKTLIHINTLLVSTTSQDCSLHKVDTHIVLWKIVQKYVPGPTYRKGHVQVFGTTSWLHCYQK